MEQAVEGAEKPEADQKKEEMLHDELEGWEVENEQDDDAGGDSVKDEGDGVLKCQPETSVAVADRCYEAL